MPLVTLPSFGSLVSASFTTWNSADKCADTTLSNGDLTAQCGTGGGYAGVRTVTGISPGEMKVWEVTFDSLALGGTDCLIGFVLSSAAVCDYPGRTTEGIGYASFGTLLYNNGSIGAFSTYTTGDTISVEVNKVGDNITSYWYKNGVLEGSDGPRLFASGTMFPFVSQGQFTGQATMTANFGPASSFVVTPQVGFTPITNP